MWEQRRFKKTIRSIFVIIIDYRLEAINKSYTKMEKTANTPLEPRTARLIISVDSPDDVESSLKLPQISLKSTPSVQS